MQLSLIFWLLMFLWLLSHFAPWAYVVAWNWIGLFLLIGALGWKVFGKPIKDG